MAIRRARAIAATCVLLVPGSALAAQDAGSASLSISQLAALVELVADFNTERGRGPLDGCDLAEATGVEPARLSAVNPRLESRIDVLSEPCAIPRHHGSMYNRGRITAIERREGGVTVHLTTQTADQVVRWDLRYDERGDGWTTLLTTQLSRLFVSGGLNSPPENSFQNSVAVLYTSREPDLVRVTPLIAAFWDGRDSVFVTDPRPLDSVVASAFRSIEGIDSEGQFLERLSCVPPERLTGRPELQFPRPANDIDCDGSWRAPIDAVVGLFQAVPPNRWQRYVWAISDEWVRVWTIFLTWDGTVESTSLVTEIGLS